MDLIEAIKGRRSVRKFSSREVSDDLVNAVLEAGRWAPSWANTQCWRFVVISDSSLRAQVADCVPSANPASGAIKSASKVIVVAGETRIAGYYKGEASTDKGDWCLFDVALATQNILLAAHSLGLGTVVTGVFDSARVAAILEVPSNVKIVALIPLGYPTESPRAPRRKELAEVAFKDKYGIRR